MGRSFPTHAETAETLVRFTGLKGKHIQAFFGLLDLDGCAPDVWNQRNLLSEELRGYLPDADADGPVQLKELVTRKATSEFEKNPVILRADVLRALKASEADLFPAPSRLPSPDGTIARLQEKDFRAAILTGVEAVRDDAETQGQNLLALARATFAVSKTEARAYFDRAIEILSRIGDENVPRWECFLHIAAVAEAPGVARAETAYRMARVGELTRSLVARDKYFDWDGTVDALAGLDPASLVTLLSRWRDRRFGDEERLLAEALEALIKRGHLTHRDSLALAGVPGLWHRKGQLEAFLETAPGPAARDAGIAIGFRYLRMEARSAKDLDDLRALAIRLGLDPVALHLPAPLSAESDFPIAKPPKEEMWRGDRSKRGKSYWNGIFKKLDPTSADDMRTAQRRVRTGEPPWSMDELFREAFSRAGGEKADAVILAIGQLPDFETHTPGLISASIS